MIGLHHIKYHGPYDMAQVYSRERVIGSYLGYYFLKLYLFLL